MYHNETWGTVCDDYWDLKEAAVVCTELDCGDPVEAVTAGKFGTGLGPIWKNNFECIGSEFTLNNCTSTKWGDHNCDHSEDAGVRCSGNLLFDAFGNNSPTT